MVATGFLRERVLERSPEVRTPPRFKVDFADGHSCVYIGKLESGIKTSET